MRNLFAILFLSTLLITVSCKKKTVERSHYYSYPLNPFYTGSHPTNNIAASVYVVEKSDHLQFQVSLSGNIDTLSYKLHIHASDLAQPFKYTGNPVIDFGDMSAGNHVIVKDIYSLSFDSLTKNFKGFFIVHDPYNIQNDTTTLLIYGKIGKAW